MQATNRKAVCGKTARTVWREGRGPTPRSYPYTPRIVFKFLCRVPTFGRIASQRFNKETKEIPWRNRSTFWQPIAFSAPSIAFGTYLQ